MKPQLILLSALSFLSFSKVNFAQAPDLRSVRAFTLFTITGAVSNTGISGITGKIGTNNGAITNFAFIPGQLENANTVTILAAADLLAVYLDIYSRSQTFPTHAAILGNGEVLYPGVYLIAEAASIEGNLVLDAQGVSNAIFIIKIQGAFAPGPSSHISLLNGALACNVFWVVEGGAIAIAALSQMKGTFIANPGAVSMAASSQLEGRLLSTTGAVAVDGITGSQPLCLVLPVTLIDFKAVKKIQAIELSWTVGNEVSFAGYELERSINGRTFYKIGSVGSTNTAFIKSYNWLDHTPLPATNFYRLKMIELNGIFKYSKILGVSMDASKVVLNCSNPVVDHILSLQLNGQTKGEYILRIYTTHGGRVANSKLVVEENDVIRNIELDKNLLPGIYLAELIDTRGNRQTMKFILE
ncbi:MAG TPA: ice-binding family protein [Chitinophagaceae bacterium]|jgi:hypothetical protein|nr:ice-binding family protein [Chitinophagaceae bacterium]